MSSNASKTLSAALCGAAALSLGLTGCGASFEGSGSKDAASAEQLALRAEDPWAAPVEADPDARSAVPLRDGVYTCSSRTTASPAWPSSSRARRSPWAASRPFATASTP